MTMTSVADQIKEALLSPYELNYATTEGKSDGLCRRLTERDVKADERSAECNCLASELEGVRAKLRWREGEAAAADATISYERARHLEMWGELELAGRWTGRPMASSPRFLAWPGQRGRVPHCLVSWPISTHAAPARPRPCGCRSDASSRNWTPCPPNRTTWTANCRTGTTKSRP